MELIRNGFAEFATNKVFFVSLYAWLLAQTLKVIIGVIRERRFDFRWFVGTGGMPSSHAAVVSALSTAVGLRSGFGSVVFVVAVVFSIIVIFDAQGVRRASGKQAEVLNKMMEDIYWKHRIQEDRLKELLGHAPLEVIVGIICGVTFVLLLW